MSGFGGMPEGFGSQDGFSVHGLGRLTQYAPTPLFGWEASLDGSTGYTLASGKPSAIADSYGGSLSLTQGTAGKRATIDTSNKLNGRPTLAFLGSGATEYASASGGVTGNADHAMIAVWKAANNSSSYAAITSFGPSGGNTSALGKTAAPWWFGGSGDVSPTTAANDDLAWHVITKRHASGKDYWFVDGAAIVSNSTSLVPNPFTQTYSITSAAFGLGTPWQSGFPCPDGNLAAAEFYGTISAANAQIVERYLALRLALQKHPQIVCKGDSLTWSAIDSSTQVASPWPQQLPALLGMSGTADATNLGVFGQLASTMLTNEGTEVIPLWSSIRGIATPTSTPRNTLVFWAGTNDANAGATASTIHTTINSYCTAAQAAGWRVIVVTPIRRTTGSTLNTTLSSLRDLINTNAGTYANGVVDLWPKAEFADVTSATYFQSDQVHLTQAGYDAVGRYVAAVAAGIV